MIKEDNAGAVNNGVKNWDGEIRIKLHAEVQDNNIVFIMRYMRFASKEALDAGITENEVRDIPVAGDNYTFGRDGRNGKESLTGDINKLFLDNNFTLFTEIINEKYNKRIV